MKSETSLVRIVLAVSALSFVGTAKARWVDVRGTVLQACGGFSVCEQISHRTRSEVVKVDSNPKVDILFVIDNSASMKTKQLKLARQLPTFLSKLEGLDWRICATTTDIDREHGRPIVFPNGSKALTPQTSHAPEVFAQWIAELPQGSSDEQGVRAISLAAHEPDSDCLREDAALASVVVSNEDEHSSGGYPEFKSSPQYVAMGRDNFPANLLSFLSDKAYTAHAIVIQTGQGSCFAEESRENEAFYGTRYEELAEATGGIAANICASDYRGALEQIARVIRNSASSVLIGCVPEDEPTVRLPSSVDDGVDVSVSNKRIFFSHELPSGTEVGLTYRCRMDGP